MKDYFKRHAQHLIGGGRWRHGCYCCSPAPKDLPALRRSTRRRAKAEVRQLAERAWQEKDY